MLHKATQEAKFDGHCTHGHYRTRTWATLNCKQTFSGHLMKTLLGFSVGLTGATIHKAKHWHNGRLLDCFCCRKPLPAQTVAKGALLFYYSTLNRHIKRINSNPGKEPVGFSGECQSFLWRGFNLSHRWKKQDWKALHHWRVCLLNPEK